MKFEKSWERERWVRASWKWNSRESGERGSVPESIELVCWGVIGEGVETEVDTDQSDTGLIEEGVESQVEEENRHNCVYGIQKRIGKVHKERKDRK